MLIERVFYIDCSRTVGLYNVEPYKKIDCESQKPLRCRKSEPTSKKPEILRGDRFTVTIVRKEVYGKIVGHPGVVSTCCSCQNALPNNGSTEEHNKTKFRRSARRKTNNGRRIDTWSSILVGTGGGTVERTRQSVCGLFLHTQWVDDRHYILEVNGRSESTAV